MKHLRDFATNFEGLDIKKGQMFTSAAGEAWAKIMSKQLKEVIMDEEELYHFFRYFHDKLPWDWNGTDFMGVQIIKEAVTSKE
jgi:hypothetical protein